MSGQKKRGAGWVWISGAVAAAMVSLETLPLTLADPAPTPVATPAADLGMPVCTTIPPADTSTRLISEKTEILTRTINFICEATAQLQPDDNPALPTYRWECGGNPNDPYFAFYLRGLYETGKLLDLSNQMPPATVVDFDSRVPNMALFFKTPISNKDVAPELTRLSVQMTGTSKVYQQYPLARVVLTEHRMLGKKGKFGELRFVRGCAEFEFLSMGSAKTERGELAPEAKFKFFFQGEFEDFPMKSKSGATPVAPPAQPSPVTPASG